MFTNIRLPQYYFGHDINRRENKENITIEVSTNAEDICLSEPNLSRISSPASSLASVKKLEWDSGADIGYIVYNPLKTSHRSQSFPSLNMNLTISQINKYETPGNDILSENKMTRDVSKGDKNCQYKSDIEFKRNRGFFQHSTPNEDKVVCKFSTNEKKYKTIFSHSVANTSKNEALQTSFGGLCPEPKQVDDSLVKICQYNSNEDKMVYHSSTEKENISANDKNKKQNLHTKYITCYSKAIQTDNNFPNTDLKVNRSLQTEPIKSSDSSTLESTSFQYIPGSKNSKSSSEISPRTDKFESRLSNLSSRTNSTNSDVSLSSTSPLAKMISTKQSSHLIQDIDKSLSILQKFIKSKNYKPETKKYYARKIISKIIRNKYDDTSSESSSTNLATEDSKEILTEIKKNENKNVIDHSKNVINGDLHVQEVDVKTEQKEDKNKLHEIDNKMIIEKLEEIICMNSQYTEPKRINKGELHSVLTNKNWKNAETLSEKLLEARKKSCDNLIQKKQSSYIVEHSKNERKRQLSWINNEISYLHRLKELLQKHETSSTVSNSSDGKRSDNKSDHTSMSEKNYSASISDITNKFYAEFGTTSSEMKNRLSKYLTNDQIKYLIDHDSRKHTNCHSCENCKKQTLDPQPVSKREESLLDDKDNYPSSFSSHNYDLENKNWKSRENLTKETQNQPVDKNADLKTEIKPEELYKNSSIEYTNTNQNIQVYYENVSSFNRSDTQSTTYGRLTDFTQMPANYQKNYCPLHQYHHHQHNQHHYHQHNKRECRQHDRCQHCQHHQTKPHEYISRRHTNTFEPIAYFLTFEQESNGAKLRRKKTLENVTVKVPKESEFDDPNSNIFGSEGNGTTLTLQECLSKNRPQFVRTANWRRSIISDQNDRGTKNIFTCSEMKEMTSRTYKRLPEVQDKINSFKILDQKRQNRCMARTFSKKLQKKALKGQMTIATCVSVMSSS